MHNKIKFKGFTVGLAVIISSAMLIISVSITSILISDMKNTLINTRSAIVYNLGETVLNCAVNLDKNIRYYTGSNSSDIEDLSGIFPKNMKIFDQTVGAGAQAIYSTAKYNSLADTFTPGYAEVRYTINNPDDMLYKVDSVKCLNKSLLTGLAADVTVYNPAAAPANLAPYDGGVVTTIDFNKADILAYSGVSEACVTLQVYAIDGNPEKLFVSTASLPCGSSQAVQRILVQYSN